MSQVFSQTMAKIPTGEETAVILAIPEDSIIFAREILKFLGTVALIAATGLLLLLAG
ncbi:MAG: hypothetical protein PHU44_15095 [Syntrophales bacterium]|nr:hypothetical protein [Syntrophales bacterium]MDD5643582.1 hypothetical protein [Syntrophales bacterium]